MIRKYKNCNEWEKRCDIIYLKEVIKQCALMCIEPDLINGNVLLDGTKIRANACRGKNYTKQHYEKHLAEIDKRIEELLEECDRIDEEEKVPKRRFRSGQHVLTLHG